MVVLTRGDQRVPDHGTRPAPLTWGPPPRWDTSEGRARPAIFDRDLALCTCAKGHTCRLSADVHEVSADGTVRPSYVCPVEGCGYHEWVRLDGWGKP